MLVLSETVLVIVIESSCRRDEYGLQPSSIAMP